MNRQLIVYIKCHGLTMLFLTLIALEILLAFEMGFFRFLIAILLIAFASTATISPLRLGGDSVNNDISINYQSTSFFIIIKTSFSYYSGEFSFCFRHRPIEDVSSSTCQLVNTTGMFDCVAFNQTAKIFMKWRMSSDYSTVVDRVPFNPSIIKNGSSIGALSFSLDGRDFSTNKGFNLVSQKNSFYEVISTTSYTYYQNSNIKTNFISTFYASHPYSGNNSENLIMQRQPVCFKQDRVYHLLFLGGVVRDTINVYIVAFVSYDTSKTDFIMWEGLSFSQDHASRDMLGLYPSTGTFTDLYSLYATAPYSDISSNINGSQSYILLASSGLSNQKNASWAYFTQLHRNFDTKETSGDEVIMFKMNNKYCFASYVDYSSSAVKSNSQFLYTSKAYKHQFMECFTPDLTLSSGRERIFWLLAVVFTLIFHNI